MFKYEINYDGTVFCGEEWETYEEAMEEAKMFIESKIADWEADDVEYDRELFSIEIVKE